MLGEKSAIQFHSNSWGAPRKVQLKFGPRLKSKIKPRYKSSITR